MNILIRADSSSQIGTGHIMRDLVFAKKYPDANIIFATQNLNGNINHKIIEAGYKIEILNSNNFEELDKLVKKLYIDMIVIDHYGIDYKFEKQLKFDNPKLKIFSFDDTYEKHYCDIVLNHNIYGDDKEYIDLVPKDCELRCGSKYTLLRDEFFKAKNPMVKKENNIFTFFVAIGGSDILNLNPKILEVFSKFSNIKVNIVTTNANNNLKELEEFCKDKKWIQLHINAINLALLMAQSDYAIITPSVTCNEVYFMELPFIAIKVADNQNYMVEFLKKNKYTVMEEFQQEKFKNLIEDIICKK